MDVTMLSEWPKLAPRTGIDVQIIVFQYVLVVAPTREVLKIVASHDDREPLVGVAITQMCQSNHCIRRYRQMHLDIAGTHAVIVVYRYAHHLQAMVVGKQSLALLERILWRNDKPHLVHIGQFEHRIGNYQMPHMYGIERTEKKTDMLQN